MSDENESTKSQEEVQQPDFVDVSDIPLPTEAVDESVKDQFDSSFAFSIVGAGQGGSRIAEAFWNAGYRRVCTLNSSEQDHANISIPDENKFLIGKGGAGKDKTAAEKLTNSHYEDILDHMRRCFGDEFDRVLICVGAGGGTGAGSVSVLIEVAHDLHTSLRIDSPVGVLVALPTVAEGRKVNANAVETLSSLFEKKGVSPLIILDNERIHDIYPKLSVDQFWSVANKSVVSLLHLFNTISFHDTPYTSFDKADLMTLLDSGVIAFGATPVSEWREQTGISFAVRDNVKRNVLAAGMDLSLGSVASCLVIGHPSVLSDLPQENLEHGFEQLTRTLAEGSTVHRGIYPGKKEGLTVFTMIGGLSEPTERMKQMASIGGVPVEDDLHT